MICNNCGTDNPNENLYCESCGQKIQYARQRVEEELADKANKKAEEQLEEQTRNILAIMIAIFILTLTARMMFGQDDWPKHIILPTSSEESSYSIRTYERSLEEYIPEKDEDLVKQLPLPKQEDE